MPKKAIDSMGNKLMTPFLSKFYDMSKVSFARKKSCYSQKLAQTRYD